MSHGGLLLLPGRGSVIDPASAKGRYAFSTATETFSKHLEDADWPQDYCGDTLLPYGTATFLPVIYHFEHLAAYGRWEAVGAGEGSGESPVQSAISNLAEIAGGNLPAGEYRYMEASRLDSQWCYIALKTDGSIATPVS